MEIKLRDVEAGNPHTVTDEPVQKPTWWKRPLQPILNKPQTYTEWLLAFLTAIFIAPFVLMAALVWKILELLFVAIRHLFACLSRLSEPIGACCDCILSILDALG